MSYYVAVHILYFFLVVGLITPQLITDSIVHVRLNNGSIEELELDLDKLCWFQPICLSIIAVLGLFQGTNPKTDEAKANLHKMLDIPKCLLAWEKKYSWMFLWPWLMNFYMKWLENVSDLLDLYVNTQFMDVADYFVTVGFYLLALSLQMYIGCTMAYVSYLGYTDMKEVQAAIKQWKNDWKYENPIAMLRRIEFDEDIEICSTMKFSSE